jgi:hypothetical protein
MITVPQRSLTRRSSQFEGQDLADKLKQLCSEEFRGPFPYDDCRWLKREFGELDDLIPHLDLWAMDVIGLPVEAGDCCRFLRNRSYERAD